MLKNHIIVDYLIFVARNCSDGTTKKMRNNIIGQAPQESVENRAGAFPDLQNAWNQQLHITMPASSGASPSLFL